MNHTYYFQIFNYFIFFHIISSLKKKKTQFTFIQFYSNKVYILWQTQRGKIIYYACFVNYNMLHLIMNQDILVGGAKILNILLLWVHHPTHLCWTFQSIASNIMCFYFLYFFLFCYLCLLELWLACCFIYTYFF